MGNLPEFAIVKDVVLFLLAIYGAALSTFNWRQATRREKRIVKVRALTSTPVFGGRLGQPFARLEAINIGHRPVTISSIAFELPGKRRVFSMTMDSFPGVEDTRLPATLSDGQTAHRHIPYREFARTLIDDGIAGKIKIYPICDDSAGNIHRGEPWEVDPKEMLAASST